MQVITQRELTHVGYNPKHELTRVGYNPLWVNLHESILFSLHGSERFLLGESNFQNVILMGPGFMAQN